MIRMLFWRHSPRSFGKKARKRNLVRFGLQKSPQNCRALQRVDHDKNRLFWIFRFIFPETNVGDIMSTPLVKFDPFRATPRPINIKLCNENMVHELLWNAKKLKDSKQFAGVRISTVRHARLLSIKLLKTNKGYWEDKS